MWCYLHLWWYLYDCCFIMNISDERRSPLQARRFRPAVHLRGKGSKVGIIISTIIITRPRVDGRVLMQFRWEYLFVFSTSRFTRLALSSTWEDKTNRQTSLWCKLRKWWFLVTYIHFVIYVIIIIRSCHYHHKHHRLRHWPPLPTPWPSDHWCVLFPLL